MINSKYVSVEPIIEGAYITTGIQSINYQEALFHIGRALTKLISPEIYVTKITNGTEYNIEPLVVEGYKALLPRDLVEIMGVRDYDTKVVFEYSTDIHFLNPTIKMPYYQEAVEELADSAATNVTPLINKYNIKPTYKINDDYIFTNIDNVKLEITYLAYPVDSRGYPLVPDNDLVREALESYLIERLQYKLMLQGKISQQVYRIAQQNSHFAMAQAVTHIATPNIDRMQSLLNSFRRMIPNVNSHHYGFANESIAERRRRH